MMQILFIYPKLSHSFIRMKKLVFNHNICRCIHSRHIRHIHGVHHVYDAHYVQMVNHEKYSLCHQNYGLLPNLKQCTKGILLQRKSKSRIVG